MAKLSVTDVPVKGKRVLVRVDFNVPLDENLNISDESRILGALPTIKYLVENGAKTILCSHLGRPKGKVVPEMSLAPVAKRLAELLPNVKVAFASDSVGEDAKTKAEQLGGTCIPCGCFCVRCFRNGSQSTCFNRGRCALSARRLRFPD